MLVSRLSEVAWGICVAIATVWLAGRISRAFGAGAPLPCVALGLSVAATLPLSATVVDD